MGGYICIVEHPSPGDRCTEPAEAVLIVQAHPWQRARTVHICAKHLQVLTPTLMALGVQPVGVV